jgi:hypothetical protein
MIEIKLREEFVNGKLESYYYSIRNRRDTGFFNDSLCLNEEEFKDLKDKINNFDGKE